MVPQRWIINRLKMYKISDEVINFIEKTMKSWRVELTAGRKNFAKTKLQRGIFQGDALSPLLFIIAMMPLNHTLRKCTAGFKLTKSQEKINYLMYMDDIKLFAKTEKELETNTRSQNTQSGYRNGIWHTKMRHASNEKWKMTHYRRKTTKSRQNSNAQRKGNLRILGEIGNWHHQTRRDERKNLERIFQKNQKVTRDKTIKPKPYQRNKYLGFSTS